MARYIPEPSLSHIIEIRYIPDLVCPTLLWDVIVTLAFLHTWSGTFFTMKVWYMIACYVSMTASCLGMPGAFYWLQLSKTFFIWLLFVTVQIYTRCRTPNACKITTNHLVFLWPKQDPHLAMTMHRTSVPLFSRAQFSEEQTLSTWHSLYNHAQAPNTNTLYTKTPF